MSSGFSTMAQSGCSITSPRAGLGIQPGKSMRNLFGGLGNTQKHTHNLHKGVSHDWDFHCAIPPNSRLHLKFIPLRLWLLIPVTWVTAQYWNCTQILGFKDLSFSYRSSNSIWPAVSLASSLLSQLLVLSEIRKKKVEEIFHSVCFYKLFNPDCAFLTKTNVGFFPQNIRSKIQVPPGLGKM